jgi:hypothetical protein
MAAPISMPVWQSVLVAHGCELDTGSKTLPRQLEPVGECLHCTPRSSGAILPFNIRVRVGQTVTITWDSELSRYIVWLEEEIAA